ncbi:Electron transfer flavoprotein large subunit, partial [Candidatus Hodgkinia cicadicola]
MESALILLEARNNKFSLNDQKLIDFISRSVKRISVLAVNCNLACAKTLNKVNKVYFVVAERPINILRNGFCFSLLVSGLMLSYDITVADNDSCFHSIICRAAAAVNRYVISGVYDILENNVFVRSIYAGRIKQHVSFKCRKPWAVSVKLPLVSDFVAMDKPETEQVKETVVVVGSDKKLSETEQVKETVVVVGSDKKLSETEQVKETVVVVGSDKKLSEKNGDNLSSNVEMKEMKQQHVKSQDVNVEVANKIVVDGSKIDDGGKEVKIVV